MPRKIMKKIVSTPIPEIFLLLTILSMFLASCVCEASIKAMFILIAIGTVFFFAARHLDNERKKIERSERIRAEMKRQLRELEQKYR